MNKLVIHIGWPKTATTSLQDNLLVELHKKGVINYFGRSSSNYDVSANSRDISNIRDFYNSIIRFPPYAHICKSMLEYRRLPVPAVSSEYVTIANKGLESSMVNVFSDEIITGPYTAPVGQSHPELLRRIFPSNSVEIIILATIRKQASLMLSQFSQRFWRLAESNLTNTPSKFFIDYSDKKSPRLWPCEYVSCADYSDILRGYSDVFGHDNVRVLLFEDILHNPDLFFRGLGDALQISDLDMLKQLFTKEARNTKDKKGRSYIVKKHPLDAISNPLLVNCLRRLGGISQKVSPRLSRKLKSQLYSLGPIQRFTKHVHTIPPFSSAEEHLIFEHFRNSNLKLADDFNLSIDSLKSYGYI